MPRDQADRADQPGQTRTQAPATPRSATARSPSSAIALARGWVFLTAVRCHGVAYHGSDTEKYLGEVEGLTRPFQCTWLKRMSSFPRLRRRRSKRHLLRN